MATKKKKVVKAKVAKKAGSTSNAFYAIDRDFIIISGGGLLVLVFAVLFLLR